MKSVDLNCDMGESFGAWKMGADEEIMPMITSSNIACGAHAGDPDVMRATVRLARLYGVAIGAHPGYPDLRWFGRRPTRLRADEVTNLVLGQIGALWAFAKAEGAELVHVKPHGALYNSACADPVVAHAVAEAVRLFSTSLILVGLPHSELQSAAAENGLRFAAEGFADRAYQPDGSLRDRELPGALLSGPDEASRQAVDLARGQVASFEGSPVNVEVQTICIHGDTPGAARFAGRIREALTTAGFAVLPLVQA